MHFFVPGGGATFTVIGIGGGCTLIVTGGALILLLFLCLIGNEERSVVHQNLAENRTWKQEILREKKIPLIVDAPFLFLDPLQLVPTAGT